MARGCEYLDLLEHAGKIPPESGLGARFAAFQSFRCGVAGQLETAVQKALAARATQDRTQLTDEWNAVVPLVLVRVYSCLGDFPAAEREAAAALAAPGVAESVKLVMVPSARALAWFETGYLAEAADAARAADADSQRLGFGQHFFAVDHLRVLSGLALERPRPRRRGAAYRTSALDNRTASAGLRIPGAAGPGADLGGPRVGP
jgi:LuxR family transcriptional regulator, maltose regulon positive regulatory protein